ncbi:protein of unknown function [Vibrio tapetis subsp. tapetis]|uniref:Uncharacterized protein n=1 Tax=Vibrio tapetis subsp. tapetis TaxID=1671868 RepID=A0A2N8ZJW0_9VIBR|nr:protein of unknown function [Vibrio tapetis subsp. tapetis]
MFISLDNVITCAGLGLESLLPCFKSGQVLIGKEEDEVIVTPGLILGLCYLCPFVGVKIKFSVIFSSEQ